MRSPGASRWEGGWFSRNQDLMLEGEVSGVRDQVSGVRCCGILVERRCGSEVGRSEGWEY